MSCVFLEKIDVSLNPVSEHTFEHFDHNRTSRETNTILSKPFFSGRSRGELVTDRTSGKIILFQNITNMSDYAVAIPGYSHQQSSRNSRMISSKQKMRSLSRRYRRKMIKTIKETTKYGLLFLFTSHQRVTSR